MYSINIALISVAFIFITVLDVSQNVKVIPQRANITYLNKKFVEWGRINVKRYGRKSDYYINLEGVKYHTWGNNITVNLVFNEFLHNEYRRSFFEMNFKLCELFADIFVGATIASQNIKCPVVERELHMMNMSTPTKNFPYKLPFERTRMDGRLTVTGTGELVAEGYIYATFKD